MMIGLSRLFGGMPSQSADPGEARPGFLEKTGDALRTSLYCTSQNGPYEFIFIEIQEAQLTRENPAPGDQTGNIIVTDSLKVGVFLRCQIHHCGEVDVKPVHGQEFLRCSPENMAEQLSQIEERITAQKRESLMALVEEHCAQAIKEKISAGGVPPHLDRFKELRARKPEKGPEFTSI